jgi:hypothetical protein
VEGQAKTALHIAIGHAIERPDDPKKSVDAVYQNSIVAGDNFPVRVFGRTIIRLSLEHRQYQRFQGLFSVKFLPKVVG